MSACPPQVQVGIDASMTNQVLVEQSLIGWKEFELEVSVAEQS